MRRVALKLGIAAAVTSAAAAWASAAIAWAADTTPRSMLDQFSCQQASTAIDREIQIQAVMRPVPDTSRMELKFVLERRSSAGSIFTYVRGHGLGRWLTPTPPNLGQQPGDVWEVSKPVFNLPAPAQYRFRVVFRWSGQDGRVLTQTARRSPVCD